jgi:hypothetical protein
MASGGSSFDSDVELALWKQYGVFYPTLVNGTFSRMAFMIFSICGNGTEYRVPGTVADTMIAHHAMYPEMAKSLGFLGSVYTDLPAWKPMRKLGKVQTEKADDQ